MESMLDYILKEVIYMAREVDENSLVVEDCGETDEALEGYKILAIGEKVPEVVNTMPDEDERKKKHLKTLLKTPKGVEVIIRYIIQDTGTTYTSQLIEKYGGVDGVLEHYGLSKPVEQVILEDDEPDDLIPESLEEDDMFDIDSEIEPMDLDELEDDEELDEIAEVEEPLEEIPLAVVDDKEEEPDIETITIAEEDEEGDNVLPSTLVEEDTEIKESEPEIEPKVNVEKHEINEENSYNKEKIKEQVEEAFDEIMPQKINEMFKNNFGDMSKNMDKMVQLLSLMVQQGGSPQEVVEEIVEPIDESEIFHKEEVEEILEHFQTEIKGIDESLLAPFISMYEGNEELVTELLLKTLEDLDRFEKEGVL